MRKKPEPKPRLNLRTEDLPATQGMLQLVRNELKSDISELRAEMKSGFSQFDSQFDGLRSEFSRVAFLVEEQNSRNKVVLEGLTALWQRQDVSRLGSTTSKV